jgi:hypothetical protein
MEYRELAIQFAYVTMFSIVFPLGAVMSLTRNLVEGHYDALTMFRDHRRPVPRRLSSKRPIGEWEKMFSIQIYISCILTGFLATFSTGHLEAYVDWLRIAVDPKFNNNQDDPFSCQSVPHNTLSGGPGATVPARLGARGMAGTRLTSVRSSTMPCCPISTAGSTGSRRLTNLSASGTRMTGRCFVRYLCTCDLVASM